MKDPIKEALIIGGIIGIAIIGGVFIGINSTKNLSATVGPEHYNREYFYGGLVQGGGIVTVTAGITVTWTAANVCDYSVIKWVPRNAISTTTTPTATSIIDKCLPKNGDFKDVIYWNAGDAASTTSFTMGTGVTAYIYEATAADKIIEGLNLAKIRFVRASSTAVYMFINEQLVQ